jgi:hypothetical protein
MIYCHADKATARLASGQEKVFLLTTLPCSLRQEHHCVRSNVMKRTPQVRRRPYRIRNPHERFFEKVRIDPSGCWIWEGALGKAGYGTFNLGRYEDGYTSAHIYTYTMLFGPVPSGLQLDHLCRVRACCNPWHLEAVSSRTNALRGAHPWVTQPRKTHCNYGHTLTEETRYASGSCRICARQRAKAWKATHRHQQ